MFLGDADDVVASGIPPTHTSSTNELLRDVGVVVDAIFDGPRRPKIPRGSVFLDKMEARAYLVADRIGHGLLPPIAPPDPQSANAIGKRAHKQVGAIAARQGKAKTALAAAIRKERLAASKAASNDPTLATDLEARVARLEADAAAVAAELDGEQYDLKLPPPMKPSRKRKAPPGVPHPPDPFREAMDAYKVQQKVARNAKAKAVLAGAAIHEATRRLDKAEKVRGALGEKPDVGYFVIDPGLGMCSDRECKERAREEETFEEADEAVEDALEALEEAGDDAAQASDNVREELQKLQLAWAEVQRVGACDSEVACQDGEPSQ